MDGMSERAPILEDLVQALRAGLGDALLSVVVFGSAADGRVRATSDVNLIVVVRSIDADRGAAVADAFRLARTAARVEPMILLECEVADAVHEFAAKFGDVMRRRRVIHGADPFSGLAIPRDVELRRLRQSLLNLTIRLRERAIVAADVRVAGAVADTSGPLRAAAAALVALDTGETLTPKEALARLAPTLGVEGVAETLALVSAVREGQQRAPSESRTALWSMLSMARAMRRRALDMPETAA